MVGFRDTEYLFFIVLGSLYYGSRYKLKYNILNEVLIKKATYI